MTSSCFFVRSLSNLVSSCSICVSLLQYFHLDGYTSGSRFWTSEPAAFITCNAIVASSSNASFDLELSNSCGVFVEPVVDFDHFPTEKALNDDKEPVVWITAPLIVDKRIVATTPARLDSLAMDSAKALFSELET